MDKVIIPLGKTVTFSFEVDGKKVDADQGIFDNKVYPYAEPLLRNKGASINKGSFTAPKDTDTYQKVYNLKIPSDKWGTDDVDSAPYPRAAGLFYLRFESKPGQYGTNGQPIKCSLLFNGKDKIENNPAWGPDKGPFEHIEGFQYDAAKNIRHKLVSEWTLTNHTPAGVYAYTPNLTSPDTGDVTFGSPTVPPPPPATPGGPSPSPVQPTFSVSVKVLVQLQIPWPDDYPPFLNNKSDDIDWKIDENGAKALGNFYGLFKLLPEEFRKDVRDVPMRRRITDKDKGGFMNQIFWEIIISDDEVKRSEGECRAVSHHFVHEMAHASNFKRTGALWGQFWPGLATVLTEIGLVVAAALVVGGVVTLGLEFVVIVAAVEVASVFLALKRDLISDWSKAAAWQCNNFAWHVIPIIGHFIGSIHKTEPNMFFSIPSLKTCGWLASYFGLENRKMLKEGSWRKAEFVSDYATNNPLEDFADSFASLVLSEKLLIKAWGMEWPDIIPPGAPNPVGKTVFPKKKKTAGDREKFMKDLYFGGGNPAQIEHHISVQYDEFDFDLSGLKKSFSTKAAAKADESRAAFVKAMAAIRELQKSWDDSTGPLFERNKEILTKLAIPVRQNPTPLELLRTLELHGHGWKLYAGKEQPVEPGDMVADAAQQTWMISVTDEQKRLQRVAGGFTYKKGMKPEDLVKEHTYFKLTWSPSSEKRNWLPEGQKASPYYKDLDAVFTHMIRLWGEQKAPESGRRMGSCKEFLHEWLHTAALWNTTYPFNPDADIREVMNYLESHGEGLQVLNVSIVPAPGDLLIPYHCSSLAMITRMNKEEQTVDVLESGTFDKGIMGEAADTARMRYGIPLSEFQYYWAPSPEPRKLI